MKIIAQHFYTLDVWEEILFALLGNLKRALTVRHTIWTNCAQTSFYTIMTGELTCKNNIKLKLIFKR